MVMARTPTTHDPFNAVAEPKRRQVLEAIGTDELSVNEIVKKLQRTDADYDDRTKHGATEGAVFP